MGAQTGHACKLYRNSATWAAPTWAELDLTRDLTLPMSRAEADVSARDSDFKLYIASLIDAGVEFQMVYDTENTDFAAVLDAFLNNTTIELAVMDGDISAAGAEGLHADFVVLKCDRSEPLEGGVVADISVKPKRTANAPEWMVVAS